MGPKPKYRAKFNSNWLTAKDDNGNTLGEYVVKSDEYTIQCRWCSKNIDISGQGKNQILQHSRSRQHRTISETRSLSQPNIFSDLSSAESSSSAPLSSGIDETHASTKESQRYGCLADRIVAAEARLCMKAVESNYSYSSFVNFCEVLRLCDPESTVFANMKMHENKVAYNISHGLGPYFQSLLIQEVNEAEVFVVGFDTSTHSQSGLTKSLDVIVRFWSTATNRIECFFYDTIPIGHETANIQVEKLLESMKGHLDLTRLFQLSRDNPNVNKATVKRMNGKVEEIGNLGLMDPGPCPIHPAHTAFRKGLDSLETNVSSFAHCLFSFFRHSTARREDFARSREMVSLEEDVTRFYLRPVDTRWLYFKNVLLRIEQNWEASIKFFIQQIPNSSDAGSKQAQKGQAYKIIHDFLRPSNAPFNHIRVQFLLYVCRVFDPYLISLQREEPLIHLLYGKCKQLVTDLLSLIVRPEDIPRDGRRLAELKVSKIDEGSFFAPPSLQDELSRLNEPYARRLKLEFHRSIVAILSHLQDRLPLKNDVVRNSQFLNPNERKSSIAREKALALAKMTKRFSKMELDKINVQYQCYQTRRFETVEHSRIDEYWHGIIGQFKSFDLEHPAELERLVRMVLSLSHGQADVERSFSQTKLVIRSRESIGTQSLKAQKLVKSYISKHGGSDKIPVTNSMIRYMRNARASYRKELQDLASKKEQAKRDKVISEQTSMKRKLAREEKVAKEEKVQKIEHEVQKMKEQLSMQKKLRQNALDAAKTSHDDSVVKVSLATTEASVNEMDSLTLKIFEKTSELMSLKK